MYNDLNKISGDLNKIAIELMQSIAQREEKILMMALTRWLGRTPQPYDFMRCSKIIDARSVVNLETKYCFFYETTQLGVVIIHDYTQNFMVEFIPTKLYTQVMLN